MKALLAKENIWWVGVLDKDLRVFDIIMHTDYGTTYNSYVVKGKDKTVLFETVKSKFFDEHLEKIKQVCNPADIDYIVVNHTEPDHSGSIEKMLEIATNATVVGSLMAINFVKEIVNKPFKSMVVTENDKIDIGGMTLNFLAVPQLHWPDSIYTYIPEAKALFTCDSFGCHYADDRVFNDLIDGDFYDAYKYYFDNIMGPFKNPYVLNAIKKIEKLDIEFVGNGHGPVLRKDIKKYFELYREWATPVSKPLSVAICYVSAYGYTQSIALKIAEGVKATGIEDVRVFDLVTDDNQKAAEAVQECTGFLLGSPTIVADALPPIYQLLIGLNPVIHKGKYAGAFGSYAWSGEAVPNLMARLQQLRFKLPLEGLRIKLKPTENDLDNAYNYGLEFANAIKNNK